MECFLELDNRINKQKNKYQIFVVVVVVVHNSNDYNRNFLSNPISKYFLVSFFL